jgi:hypothetical protein
MTTELRKLIDEANSYLKEYDFCLADQSRTDHLILYFLLEQVIRLEKRIESLEYQKAPADTNLGGPMSGSFIL